MKVSGKIIKHRRLAYGLSQYQLANGICAQATISLIENRNSCPKLGILTRISQRLNIPVHSVIKSSVDLADVEDAIVQGSYKKAKRRLLRIPRRQFKQRHQMRRYFCYQGLFSLMNGDEKDALYFFNKALSQNLRTVDNYCQAWANVGLGYAYYKQNDKVKSLEFARIAKQNLKLDLNDKDCRQIKGFVILRLKLAELCNRLNVYKLSNSICFQTVADSVEIHSMYKLFDVYNLISQNYFELNRVSVAKLAKHHANVFQQIYREPDSLSLRS